MDFLSSKNIFAITTGCKYFKFEENMFCLHDGVLYLVDYDDFSKMFVVDNSFFEYDYPQFALPLYNLCSNVGLYETAAITNRSNILSPKYLRLNL